MDDTAADDESITPDDDNAVAKDGHTYGQTDVWMDRAPLHSTDYRTS